MSTVSEATTQEGSLTGSILMIAGCCIGAGMISLPAVTALSGFLPSVAILLFAWAFMVGTGLLLLEINLLFPKNTNLLTMAQRVLGKTGQTACAGLFIFLFFSLLIAYISGTGCLLTDFFSLFFHKPLNPLVGNVFCAIFLFLMLLKGTHSVDWINRISMIGMMIAYVMLVGWGMNQVAAEHLSRACINKQLLLSVPFLLLSFGYQNLIPSITSYLNHNKQKIRFSIIVGCSIPLIMYIVWELIILGILNRATVHALSVSAHDEFIIHFLQRTISSNT